jgi:hypothetical protein
VGFAVDEENRARFDYAGQVEELIALAEGLLAGAFGGALEDRDGVADFLDHAGSAGGVFFGRECVGEDGLGARDRCEGDQGA